MGTHAHALSSPPRVPLLARAPGPMHRQLGNNLTALQAHGKPC